MVFDRNVETSTMITCPAVILAASRNERVIGRTESLVDSTNTRNGLSHAGAPLGRRDAINFIGSDVKEDRISLSQSVRPNERVNKRCLVSLKMNGVSPIRLIKIKKANSVEMNEVHPRNFLARERDSWSKIVSSGR